jgi:two-component system, OmpR family, sensor histidine kinase SenX3
MIHIRPPAPPSQASDGRTNAIFVQRFESTTVLKGNGAPSMNLFTDGIWELDVAHRGVPLAVAFEQVRRRNLLLSLGVEALLLVAIVFLVLSVRRMQRLAEQKMQFVAAVSHELRTPVSAISMLSRNQADGLVAGADRVKQYGELIHQESRRLNEMVEQTLQYAGIHSGLRRRANVQVDLRALIHDAVEARRDDLVRRGFEIEVKLSPDLPAVPGDATLLRTAFENLLSNAEKYSGGGRWIRVGAEYSAGHKEVTISVEDRGFGVDPADRSEIFEPFARGQAAIDAQIPGSGLGLALVRSAAEAHHGTVTLVSEPGRGSVFTMHLPL